MVCREAVQTTQHVNLHRITIDVPLISAYAKVSSVTCRSSKIGIHSSKGVVVYANPLPVFGVSSLGGIFADTDATDSNGSLDFLIMAIATPDPGCFCSYKNIACQLIEVLITYFLLRHCMLNLWLFIDEVMSCSQPLQMLKPARILPHR